MHGGVDYYAADKSLTDVAIAKRQVYCVANGWIRVKGYDAAGYGYYVIVNHEGNRDTATDLCTLYAHMPEPSPKSIGDYVTTGTVIGYIGHSGNASTTWSHLHFEIRSKDLTHYYDPIPYMLSTYIGDTQAVWESWVRVYHPSSVTRGNSIKIDVKVTRAHLDDSPVGATKAVVRWRGTGTSFSSSPAMTSKDAYGNIVGSFTISSADYGSASKVEFYVEAYKDSSQYATSPVDNLGPPDAGNYYKVSIN